MNEIDLSDRRNFLKAGGAALAAASLSSVAKGEAGKGGSEDDPGKILYAHGMVWNRDLPGVLGELLLKFDVTARIGGTGLGTFGDDVHPEFNSHFNIDSAVRHGDSYTFKGEIISSRDPSMVGTPVKIVADVDGLKTEVKITIGSNTFLGAGLVVIAIIAILIGLLVPAVQCAAGSPGCNRQ